jgi:hypothetical protein
LKVLWDVLKNNFSTTNKTELAFAALTSLHEVKLRPPNGAKNVTFSIIEKHIYHVAGLFGMLEKLKFSIMTSISFVLSFAMMVVHLTISVHASLFDHAHTQGH